MAVTTPTSFGFVCYGCGERAPGAMRATTCAACGEPMAIEVEARPYPAVFHRAPASMWTYFDLLPIEHADDVVSLNEGATPLIDAPRLCAAHGLGRVLLKDETGNPTGSFKDRQVSVGISHARALGFDTVAVVSSGNVACATAAYAARAGMKAVLFMHGMAAQGKIAQAAAYGATVIKVQSPSASAVFNLCVDACREFGWYHLSTSGMHEPFNVEGAKTIAYELYQQTGGRFPDWIVAPVGGGGLLGGVWRGLLDLKRLRLIDALPKLAGVQASGCAPLKKAIVNGTPFLDTLRDPWPNPRTIAGGIADDILFDGHTVLPAIRTTNGAALAVDDDEIIAAEIALAQSEGVLCDPCSACSIAALAHLPGANEHTSVCCIVTGTGIKDLAALDGKVPPAIPIDASLDSVRNVINGIPR
ncbi:MAG: pyridoxal-phosphate dependent enzyme [Candidatus Hydrogenedentes bacterium]|nr:pyridoxal-phosphate dependent enzyme [Candidatus Hydrogenedentota bacterium]